MMTSQQLVASILDFTQRLVQVPSQANKDALAPVLQLIGDWLSTNGLRWELLEDDAERGVGILVTVDSERPGPVLCLDAPIDTAPVGRLDAWKVPPFSGVIDDGKMYGRGVADSKVAASIFCHLAREFERTRALSRGVLHVLLDGDEHTGDFGGVKAYVERRGIRPSFVAIGYPGNYGVIIGARGFFRARVRTFGRERHSGARADTRFQNAIVKMSRLIQLLSSEPLPRESDPDFEFGPKVSVTEISGGSGFSQIPGTCEVNVDIRLTPSFAQDEARALIERCLKRIDEEIPMERPSLYDVVATWPWYKLQPSSKEFQILRECAEDAFAKSVELVVCGPSNIGNYLAANGIPATCGFGVTYENQHAANECIELASIHGVYQTYHCAVERWAAGGIGKEAGEEASSAGIRKARGAR